MKFWDYGEDLKVINRRLSIIAIGEAGLIVILIIAILVMTFRINITYIDVDKVVGETVVGHIPAGVPSIFVRYYFYQKKNVNPGTVDGQYALAYRLMTSRYASEQKPTLLSEINRIKESQLAYTFTPDGEPDVAESSNGYEITIKGDQRTYIGGKESGIKNILCKVKVVRGRYKTPLNPFGLEIDDENCREIR
ncbi:MAG: TraE/TraK family type IV conjugative transfer system protein [Nitrospirota bacterium]